jgi:hypothetical protein
MTRSMWCWSCATAAIRCYRCRVLHVLQFTGEIVHTYSGCRAVVYRGDYEQLAEISMQRFVIDNVTVLTRKPPHQCDYSFYHGYTSSVTVLTSTTSTGRTHSHPRDTSTTSTGRTHSHSHPRDTSTTSTGRTHSHSRDTSTTSTGRTHSHRCQVKT